MKIYTIGFTKKSAHRFFSLLGGSNASVLVDTRLNNVSQLAGFTKRDDLEFFCRELCGMTYRHELRLAPSKEFLKSYKDGAWSWSTYEMAYNDLLRSRRVESVLRRQDFDNVVFLCSESTPEKCHRRLAAEYLAEAWGDVTIEHL